MNIDRRTFIVVAIATMSGCSSNSDNTKTTTVETTTHEDKNSKGLMGYVLTDAANYDMLDMGITGDTLWADVRYTGPNEGKVQFRIHVQENGVHVASSGVQAMRISPHTTQRVDMPAENYVVDEEELAVYLEIVNSQTDSAENTDKFTTSE